MSQQTLTLLLNRGIIMKIVKKLISKKKYSLKCPYDMKPTRVVVHNTANDAPARNEINYMCNNNNRVSFHWAVDDKEAVQGIPENRTAWHAGDGYGKGNKEGIAVEICYSKSGGARFEKAEDNAAELIADILRRYNWGIEQVTKHQDYSGKNCPHRTLELGWPRFLQKIKDRMDGDFAIGDKVKLKAGATYYNGKAIPSWLLKMPLYVRSINGNRVVVSILKIGAITGAVNKKYLTK